MFSTKPGNGTKSLEKSFSLFSQLCWQIVKHPNCNFTLEILKESTLLLSFKAFKTSKSASFTFKLFHWIFIYIYLYFNMQYHVHEIGFWNISFYIYIHRWFRFVYKMTESITEKMIFLAIIWQMKKQILYHIMTFFYSSIVFNCFLNFDKIKFMILANEFNLIFKLRIFCKSWSVSFWIYVPHKFNHTSADNQSWWWYVGIS